MAGRKPRMLTARITHLEMTEPPARRVPMPVGDRLAIMRASGMPLSFYRYLYAEIGRPHHWMERRDLDDAALARIVHADTTQIDVLYVNGSPGGFFELDLARLPEVADLVYFGLLPDFQGRGLARFFLSEAVLAAWAHDPRRVTVSTNTLDSPRALQLYQKIGFAPVAWSEAEIAPWA